MKQQMIEITKELSEQMTQWYCYSGCYSPIGGSRENHQKKYHKDSSNGYYLAILPNELTCPYCDQIMMKYVNPEYPEWLHWSCKSKVCKYRKLHNSMFLTTEFTGIRKKYHCANHNWNDDKPCERCIEQKKMNKELGIMLRSIMK